MAIFLPATIPSAWAGGLSGFGLSAAFFSSAVSEPAATRTRIAAAEIRTFRMDNLQLADHRTTAVSSQLPVLGSWSLRQFSAFGPKESLLKTSNTNREPRTAS